MKYLGKITDNKDLVTKEYVDNHHILKSKTFTNVIGTANNWAGATFFFGSVKPESWDTTWRIKYRINVYVPNHTDYCQMADVMISGKQGDFRSYYSMNTIGSYYVCYYHELYSLKSAGFTNGYGHSIGVRFYSAYNPINTDYKRTIEVEIIEMEHCIFDFYDNCLLYASIPGTGSTNYNTYTELDFVTNGLQETGDANDVNYYNREYYTSRTTKNALYRYQMCLTTSTGQLIPVNSVNNSVATNKTLTTDKFDPFGEIFYWASTSTYSAGANIGNVNLYRQYLADLRYSFNCGGYDTTATLTARLPLYLVCNAENDGTATLHSSPLSQTLPDSDNGLIYIYLGRVYEDTKPYRVVLSIHHPVYWYRNGNVIQYVKEAATVNGHTVAKDVPSDAIFTDTTYESKTAASGGTAVSLVTTGEKYTWNNKQNALTNPVTGTGTSGYLAKFNGNTTVTNGPQIGSDTTKFLRNDGSWAVPPSSSSGVTGVKGDSESSYRTGDVNITKANIGLGNVVDGAEVNQNAFSNVKVGSTTVAADTKTDTLELAAGSNITLTPDSTNDKVTIALANTGTVKKVYAAAKTVNNNSNTNLTSISLEAGTWVVTAGVRFPSNASGLRRMNIATASGSANADVQTPAASGGSTQLAYTVILSPTSTTTYYLNCYQNSGTNMSLVAGGGENGLNFIRAVRIL